MDEEFDASLDTSDVDTSTDMDTSDVVDDVPDDIPEDVPDDVPKDIPEDELETPEEDYLSEDIPEDVPADEPEVIEEDELSDDIPEDVLGDEPEAVEENDLSEDVPEDVPEDQVETDDTTTEETAEDTTSDVDSADTAEPIEETQDELLDDTTVEETAEDTASDVDSDNFGEQTDTQNKTVADEANEFNDGTQDDPSKVLKRDELDLLKSGNDAINQRLEAQADDYRDKGMSEDEIRDRLAADKWNFQKEFLEDAFSGQDVSPNVFNGLSENGSKDRIDEIENSDTLKNQLKKEGTDTIGDSIPETDNQAIEDEGRSDGVSDSSKVMNDVSEDESIKDLRNKFAAFLNKQDITANAPNDTKEVNKDVESAQKMIDDYCNNDLKGVLSDDKKAVRLGDTVEFQDDEDFAKGLGSKERAAGVNG